MVYHTSYYHGQPGLMKQFIFTFPASSHSFLAPFQPHRPLPWSSDIPSSFPIAVNFALCGLIHLKIFMCLAYSHHLGLLRQAFPILSNLSSLNHVLLLGAKLCPTLCNPMNCSSPGSSVHRISQARILERVVISSSRDLPHPGIEPLSPAWQVDS